MPKRLFDDLPAFERVGRGRATAATHSLDRQSQVNALLEHLLKILEAR